MDPKAAERGFRAAVEALDAQRLREVVEHAGEWLDAPIFAFDAPALVHASFGKAADRTLVKPRSGQTARDVALSRGHENAAELLA